MKIEMRKLRVHKDMSEETTCFSAELFIDGRRVAHVSNDGHGGCDRLVPWSVKDTLDAYAKTLPDRSGGYPASWESVLAEALERATARKDFDRQIKGCVLMVGKDGKVRRTKKLTAAQLAAAVEVYKGRGERVLNLLPVEEAFEAYFVATGPDAADAGGA
jgi:hypothetical protein